MKIILFLALLVFYSSAQASTCVDVDLNGFLVTTSQSIDDCITAVVMSKDDYIRTTNTFDLFSMTKEQGFQLSAAFLLMLSTAIVIKITMRQLVPK